MMLSKDYLFHKIYDTYTLIPVGQAVMDGKESIVLNEFSAAVISNLLEDISKEALIENLSKEYELDENILNSFLDELYGKKLLTI